MHLILNKRFSFETQPHDKKKVFSLSSAESKNWVLNGEELFVDYLLPDPGKYFLDFMK